MKTGTWLSFCHSTNVCLKLSPCTSLHLSYLLYPGLSRSHLTLQAANSRILQPWKWHVYYVCYIFLDKIRPLSCSHSQREGHGNQCGLTNSVETWQKGCLCFWPSVLALSLGPVFSSCIHTRLCSWASSLRYCLPALHPCGWEGLFRPWWDVESCLVHCWWHLPVSFILSSWRLWVPPFFFSS